MKITFEGVQQAPMWADLQRIIGQMLGVDIELVGILRLSNGCDYRELGQYRLTIRTPIEILHCDLDIR